VVVVGAGGDFLFGALKLINIDFFLGFILQTHPTEA
jgi:hypothetical protein